MNKQNLSGVYINSSAINNLYIADYQTGLMDMIERPQFRIPIELLSYRYISSLHSDLLLPDNVQKIERGWRKFSVKDFIYLMIIKELKSFGVKNANMKNLKELFYEKESSKGTEAIGLVFGHIEISVLYYSDGTIVVTDILNAAIWESQNRPNDTFIKISLNKLVNNALANLPVLNKLSPMKPNETSTAKLLNADLDTLSKKEKEAINLIRYGDYESLNIRIKDNSPTLLTGKKTISEYTEQKKITGLIIEMMNTKDFGDIKIKKRNGRYVHVTSEDTIKL